MVLVLTDRASEDAERRAVAATNARVLDSILILCYSSAKEMSKRHRRRGYPEWQVLLVFVHS